MCTQHVYNYKFKVLIKANSNIPNTHSTLTHIKLLSILFSSLIFIYIILAQWDNDP